MSTLQGLRQASARSIHGLGDGRNYNEDMRLLFEAETAIPDGTSFNGAFLLWLEERLGTSFDSLIDAQNAFAVDLGLRSWGEVGSFGAGFSPVSIDFPGSSPPRWALSGAIGADSTTATMTWWEKPDASLSSTHTVIGNNLSTGGVRGQDNNARVFSIAYQNGSNNRSFQPGNTADLIREEWNFVALSFDMAAGTGSGCVVNSAGVATFSTVTTTGSPSTISFSSMTSTIIGSATTSGILNYFGELAEITVHRNTGLIDFSDADNRRLFISADGPGGVPVSLGADGSTPFGAAPMVYMTGPDAASWNNVGAAGAFTLTGTANAGTAPLIPGAVTADFSATDFDATDFAA